MGLQDLQLKVGEHLFQQALGVQPAGEGVAHRAHPANSGLDLVDQALLCAGQQLDQIAAGGQDALVPVHQNSQGAGGGDLLAFHKVHGDVVGDLPGEQADRADIGFLQSQVLDDGETAVGAHGGPHIQLTGDLLHQLYMGILHIAPHVPAAVGDSQNGAQGPAALDLEGESAVVLFQHIPHHGGGQQGAAQGGGGHGEQGVDGAGTLHQVPAGDGDSFDRAVGGDGADDMVGHDQTSFRAVKKMRSSPGLGGRCFRFPYCLIWVNPASRR